MYEVAEQKDLLNKTLNHKLLSLPTIETPTYELKLHSSNKKIKYRPFLVKEEKVCI